MNKEYFVGIDLGTQGIRCGIVDVCGGIMVLAEEKYDTIHPKPGYAEQDPAGWIVSLERVLYKCRAQVGGEVFGKITGITICSTSSTVLSVDDNENPIMNAILWMDNRAAAQTEAINGGGHEVLKYCGREVSTEWIVPKMMWIKENMPEVFAKSRRIVEAQDFLNHYFTGVWRASVCQATCKSNYVEELGGFQEDFFRSIGLPEFFDKADLDVVVQAAPVGLVKRDVAARFGFSPHTMVYQGGIDAHVNGIGLGVSRPGETGVVMGSSFVQLALVENEFFGDGIWGPYKSAVIPNLYCLEGGQVSAASITKWFVREFRVEGENPYATMASEAEAIPPGSEGLVMLDFFQGNRTPFKDANAKGVFFGLTLAHSRAHMYRAVLEGVAYGTRNIIDTMENGREIMTELRGCGGVTNNRMWLQIISDVTNKPIVLTESSGNAGVLGCAIISAVGSGMYSGFGEACDAMVKISDVVRPDAARHALYEKPYEKYLALYRNLKKLF